MAWDKRFLKDSSKSFSKLFLLLSGIISYWVFLIGRLVVKSIEFPIWILHKGDKVSLLTPDISILDVCEEFWQVMFPISGLYIQELVWDNLCQFGECRDKTFTLQLFELDY